MPQVDALCISETKGVHKHAVESAHFRTNHGIERDAHAGEWHRQVSLLANEDIQTVRQALPGISPGAFAENVVLSGLDFSNIGLGTRLQLGKKAVLSITQIGKACHAPCRIHELTGDCIMPRLGLFARVVQGGEVQTGDSVDLLNLVPRNVYQAVVLTISDRCAAGETEDTAGPAVCSLLRDSLQTHIYTREIVPDERDSISKRLKHYCDGHSIDLVLAVGGTGFSPRDVTPEATRDVADRLCPGLDEAMRAASLLKTKHAMLSRGVSGIRKQTLIVNLPGSERAALENLEVILPALSHGLDKLRGDRTDCGRLDASDGE